jgi:two-component system sensor histidine kinase UhpB
MIDAMSDIVWSISPRNDLMEDMLVRMKQYVAEMMEPKNISYDFITDEKLSRIKFNPGKRKDVYLIFKESINNAVKHAQCRNVTIELKYSDGSLKMKIADDGMGFETNGITIPGNGLSNLKERAKNLKAAFDIQTSQGKGTTISVKIPLT